MTRTYDQRGCCAANPGRQLKDIAAYNNLGTSSALGPKTGIYWQTLALQGKLGHRLCQDGYMLLCKTKANSPNLDLILRIYVEWGQRETILEDECTRFEFGPSQAFTVVASCFLNDKYMGVMNPHPLKQDLSLHI